MGLCKGHLGRNQGQALCGREEEWFGDRHRMKGTTAWGCGLLRGAVLLKLVQSPHPEGMREFRLRRGADRNSTHAQAGTRGECSNAPTQEGDLELQTGLS